MFTRLQTALILSAVGIASVLFCCINAYPRLHASDAGTSSGAIYRLVQESTQELPNTAIEALPPSANSEAYRVHIYKHGQTEEVFHLCYDPEDLTGNIYVGQELLPRTIKHCLCPEQAVDAYMAGLTRAIEMPAPGTRVPTTYYLNGKWYTTVRTMPRMSPLGAD